MACAINAVVRLRSVNISKRIFFGYLLIGKIGHMKFIKFFVPAFFLFHTSCMTIGKNFSNDIKWIVKGTTTLSEIRQKLGEPFRIGYDNGALSYTYAYYRYSLFRTTRTKDLNITFDSEKKVTKFSYATSFPDDKNNIYHKEKIQ